MENFSVTPHFPCNLMPGSLDKFYFSSSILHTFCGFPREIAWSIDLHDATPSSVIQVGCWFHTQPHNQHFFVPPNHIIPLNIHPRVVFCQLYIHLEELSKFLFQSNHGSDKNLSCSWDDTLASSRSLSPSTLRSVAEPRNSLVLAAVGCRCRLLMHAEGQRHYKDSLLFLA